jgi:hypothetical protein
VYMLGQSARTSFLAFSGDMNLGHVSNTPFPQQ